MLLLNGSITGHSYRTRSLSISAPCRHVSSGLSFHALKSPYLSHGFADPSVHTVILDNDSQDQIGVYAAGKSAKDLLEVAQLKTGKNGTLKYLDGLDLIATETKVGAGTLVFIPSPYPADAANPLWRNKELKTEGMSDFLKSHSK